MNNLSIKEVTSIGSVTHQWEAKYLNDYNLNMTISEIKRETKTEFQLVIRYKST